MKYGFPKYNIIVSGRLLRIAGDRLTLTRPQAGCGLDTGHKMATTQKNKDKLLAQLTRTLAVAAPAALLLAACQPESEGNNAEAAAAAADDAAEYAEEAAEEAEAAGEAAEEAAYEAEAAAEDEAEAEGDYAEAEGEAEGEPEAEAEAEAEGDQ